MQRRKSTGHTDRKKALKVAEQFEQVGQRKLAPRTVRETLAELYREIHSETLPVPTVRKFIGDWLHTKQPEVSERFVIFVISLHRDFLPSAWRMYYPTWWMCSLSSDHSASFLPSFCYSSASFPWWRCPRSRAYFRNPILTLIRRFQSNRKAL